MRTKLATIRTRLQDAGDRVLWEHYGTIEEALTASQRFLLPRTIRRLRTILHGRYMKLVDEYNAHPCCADLYA